MLMFTIFMVAGIGVASLVLWQKERTQKGPLAEEPRSQERTLKTLRLGDVVQHLGKDYLVEGKLTYNEDGFIWHEYMLVDRTDVRWLAVEQDDRLIVALYQQVPATDLLLGASPPETVSYQGIQYRLDERGSANMTRQGEVGQRNAERCRYFDYVGQGGRLLSVEYWGETPEVCVGEEIREASLEILPGS
jgi:hypothetical protein